MGSRNGSGRAAGLDAETVGSPEDGEALAVFSPAPVRPDAVSKPASTHTVSTHHRENTTTKTNIPFLQTSIPHDTTWKSLAHPRNQVKPVTGSQAAISAPELGHISLRGRVRLPRVPGLCRIYRRAVRQKWGLPRRRCRYW